MESFILDSLQARSFVVAIHDVSPRFEDEVAQLRELLSQHVDQGKLALLVVPDYWQEAPIVPGSAFAGKLRRWADQGNEIFLHGWSHRDRVDHKRAIDRFRARHMTAGEAEFLGLDHDAATGLIRRGRALLEDVTGRPVSGFVAPAWLYGRDTLTALAELDFPIAEDHFDVWHPPTGKILSRGPVITWASRSQGRILSSIAFAAAARWMLCDIPLVRVAVHPGDIRVPELRASISKTLAYLERRREAGCYANLLSGIRSPADFRRAALP